MSKQNLQNEPPIPLRDSGSKELSLTISGVLLPW